MFMNINPHGAEPLADQIASGLRKMIVTGEFAVSDVLPTPRELVVDLRVNPKAVSDAFTRLEDEGLIARTDNRDKFLVTGEFRAPER